MAGVKGRSGGPRPNSGGARPGAGRPKKAPEVVEVILADQDGKDPLSFLEAVMSDSSIDMKHRIDAAKTLATYRHKKAGEAGKKEEIAAKAKKAASKFASSAPPKLIVNNR